MSRETGYITTAADRSVAELAKWGSALFVDGGNAVDSLDGLTPIYGYGYGAGARWKSPVGPLNLDIAYGQEAHAARVHFSVGFSF